MWFSADPEIAWAERLFLIYSPVWMAAMGTVMVTGVVASWGSVPLMFFGVACGLPTVVLPWALWSGTPWAKTKSFTESYAFRLNVWMAIFVWCASYFHSHYFFDVLGMHYNFPTSWNLQAAIGSDENRVPLFLYPLTQAYFVTYHTLMILGVRRLGAWLDPGRIARAALICVVCYLTAFAETYFMASPLIEDYFWYEDRNRMLQIGSVVYALYFVVSLPMVMRLQNPASTWPHSRIAIEALAASMLSLILVDVWASLVGPLS